MPNQPQTKWAPNDIWFWKMNDGRLAVKLQTQGITGKVDKHNMDQTGAILFWKELHTDIYLCCKAESSITRTWIIGIFYLPACPPVLRSSMSALRLKWGLFIRRKLNWYVYAFLLHSNEMCAYLRFLSAYGGTAMTDIWAFSDCAMMLHCWSSSSPRIITVIKITYPYLLPQ